MTREAQIRQTASEWLRYNHPTCTQDMLVEAFRCGAEWADKNPVNPWISVEDEKPAQDKDVVFMLPDGLVYRGFRKVIGIRDRVFLRGATNGTNCYMISDVSHWMPIHELPK